MFDCFLTIMVRCHLEIQGCGIFCPPQVPCSGGGLFEQDAERVRVGILSTTAVTKYSHSKLNPSSVCDKAPPLVPLTCTPYSSVWVRTVRGMLL